MDIKKHLEDINAHTMSAVIKLNAALTNPDRLTITDAVAIDREMMKAACRMQYVVNMLCGMKDPNE